MADEAQYMLHGQEPPALVCIRYQRPGEQRTSRETQAIFSSKKETRCSQAARQRAAAQKNFCTACGIGPHLPGTRVYDGSGALPGGSAAHPAYGAHQPLYPISGCRTHSQRRGKHPGNGLPRWARTRIGNPQHARERLPCRSGEWPVRMLPVSVR